MYVYTYHSDRSGGRGRGGGVGGGEIGGARGTPRFIAGEVLGGEGDIL